MIGYLGVDVCYLIVLLMSVNYNQFGTRFRFYIEIRMKMKLGPKRFFKRPSKMHGCCVARQMNDERLMRFIRYLASLCAFCILQAPASLYC